MIYIRVELWPGTDRKRTVTLGEATITNKGDGAETSANYNVVISKRGGFRAGPQYLDHERARVCLPAPLERVEDDGGQPLPSETPQRLGPHVSGDLEGRGVA